MTSRLSTPVILLGAAMLAACASSPPQQVMVTPGSTLVQTARVTEVRDVAVQGGRASGAGSLVGAIVGGVVGSRFGEGTGKAVAGVGGSLAGSVAGQRIEEAGKSSRAMELTVQLDNGDLRTYRVDSDESFRVGDQVTITTSNGVSKVVRQ